MTQKPLPCQVNEWTKEQVSYWLTEEVKVDEIYAKTLYDEDVSGDALVYYQLKDLRDLGIKHGPAVKILNRFKELKQQHEHERLNQDDMMKAKDAIKDMSTDQTQVPKQTGNKSSKIKKIQKPNSKHNSADMITSTQNDDRQLKERLKHTPLQKMLKCHSASKDSIQMKESADLKASVSNAENIRCIEKRKGKDGQHSCSLYPFDQSSASHRYIQNYTLPPETGPGNLIDPVHEYKFMGRADDINVIKRKFNKEVFRFAAGCMNSRTNGTIHFGVADSKDSQYAHGEIIGVSVENKDSIIDHFNQGIKSYFEEHTDKAKACVRQPRFVEVLCPDGTLSGKYVIEVDVVPSHSIVHGTLFKTQTLDEDNQWKRSKGNSLFIRDGAATRDIFKIGNPKDLNVLDIMRKDAETRPESKGLSNQGEKLKGLMTCGTDRLGYYDYYIIVTNKSHPDQLQHLQFMTTLKLFCVLDFDPNSIVNGSCHGYRDERIANLHKPSQFHGDPETIVKNLHLYKQTSWVFCNGREDLNTESDRPLNSSTWFKHKAREVNDMILFLCNPDTLPRGRFLVIFLLLSTAEAVSDPIYETFMSFYKKLGGTENILSICTSDASFTKWRDHFLCRVTVWYKKQVFG